MSVKCNSKTRLRSPEDAADPIYNSLRTWTTQKPAQVNLQMGLCYVHAGHVMHI